MEYDVVDVDYYCEAFPRDSEEQEQESSSSSKDQLFNIKFEVSVLDLFHPPVDDPEVMIGRYWDPDEYFFPNIPRDSLLKDRETTSSTENEETILLNMLSQMDISHSAQNSMVAKILVCARDMAYRTHKTSKVLSLEVHIFLTRINEGQEPQEPNFSEGENDHEFVPATEASIEQLESIKVEGERQKCAICLEDFMVGLQVTRMPCLHLYHDKCIVDWLHKGNSCPLCRFMMPATGASE